MTIKTTLFLSAISLISLQATAGERHNPAASIMQQAQYQGQSQKIEGGNAVNEQTLNTIVQNNEKRRPVNTAIGTSVYSSNECMGSTAVGGQGLTIGLSFGTTWSDNDCKKFKAAAEFERAGYKEDALVIMCSSDLAKDAPSCKAIKLK